MSNDAEGALRPVLRIRCGFTLAEMLVVMAIIALLMSLAAGSLRTPSAQSEQAAAEIARAMGYAREYAVARNRTAWVRLQVPEEEPHDLELRFYFSKDGSDRQDTIEEFRRRMVIEDIVISKELDEFDDRPKVPVEDRFDTEGFLLITPGGQAHFSQGTEGDFPAPEAELRRSIELGIQPTRGGRVTDRMRNEVSAVHINGATGAAIVYTK